MWYLITAVLCVLIIIFDNKKRKANLTKYIILSIIIPPIGFGLWQAEKPLLPDKKRYGGKGWNVMKWFAIFHTLLCFIWIIYATAFTGSAINASVSDAEKVGSAIGGGLSILIIGAIWFFGVLISLVIGLFLKKPITEEYQP